MIPYGSGGPRLETSRVFARQLAADCRAFREELPFDEAAWARGRGWAIWKAMKVLVGALKDDTEDAAFTTRVIEAILADHVAAA